MASDEALTKSMMVLTWISIICLILSWVAVVVNDSIYSFHRSETNEPYRQNPNQPTTPCDCQGKTIFLGGEAITQLRDALDDALAKKIGVVTVQAADAFHGTFPARFVLHPVHKPAWIRSYQNGALEAAYLQLANDKKVDNDATMGEGPKGDEMV